MLQREQPSSLASRTERDRIWAFLWKRQRPRLDGRMHSRFLEGLERSGLEPGHLPRHGSLSRRLHDVCGWRIETVPGLIPVRDFFGLLRERRFPSPDWLRSWDELDYTPAPDAFHDVFGHVPQLCMPEVTEFLEHMAARAMTADDAELVRLERLYWFTIEFGLVREAGELRALGAGLASSVEELERSLDDPSVERRAFGAGEAMAQPFDSQHAQELYFVLPSLAALSGVPGTKNS